MAKVSTDFSSHNFTDNGLCVKANSISDGLTDNPDFASLATVATQIRSESNALLDLLTKMNSGNKQLTVQKRNARAALENTLHTVAYKVQDLSGGDESKILSTGFDVIQKPSPVGLLDQPINVQVKQGKISGSLELSWDVVDHAHSYEVRCTKNPKTTESVYQITTTTKSKAVVSGLDLGQTFSLQVAGVGSDPRRVWSVEVVSCYVS
ncbi:MAG: hypothetical protein H6Q17_1021 [Bacteroidetes bacterium]|jgi:hypothetical protein|nr:hypothetical protein [Bacteroidota bacterium]